MGENIGLVKRVKYAGDVHAELLKAGWDLDTATRFVESIPDADAVPVVRCKECKHYVERKEISKKCCYVHLLTPHPMPEDGFCSYGERKGGGING